MDLFNQTLILSICAAATVLIFRSVILIKKNRPRSHIGWIVRVGIIGSIVVSLALWLIFSSIYSQDQIPYEFMIWALPLGFSAFLIIISFRSPYRLIIAILATLFAALLLLLSINNYYHYYPTIGAVFQTDKSTTVAAPPPLKQTTGANLVVLEQYYQAPSGQTHGSQLLPLDIPSSSSSFSPRLGRIYLPPALSGNDQIKLPVIVLLAGYPGSPVHWEQAGIVAIMDSFAAAHKGLSPIVALVDFTGTKDLDTECVDSKQGSAETYLTKDVPTYLKQHYQVQTDPSAWAIGGYSAGGTCGPIIALRNPTIYQNYLNISGDTMPTIGDPGRTLATLFNGSQQQQLEHTPNYLLEKGNPLYSKIRGWYFYGKQDNPALIRRMQDQYNLAKQAGLTVKIQNMDGHHSFIVWKEGFVEGLPWISNQMKLTTL